MSMPEWKQKLRDSMIAMGLDPDAPPPSRRREPDLDPEMARCLECDRLRETNSRLMDDMAGLEERIVKGDLAQAKRIEELEQKCDEYRDQWLELLDSKLSDEDRDFEDRYHDRVLKIVAAHEHIRALELENAALRRMLGSGTGRTGRPPSWTPVQMSQVREMHAAGKSLREITRETRLSTSQVRTILARPSDALHPETAKAQKREQYRAEQDAKLVRTVQGLSHVIRGGSAIVAGAARQRQALQKAANLRKAKA